VLKCNRPPFVWTQGTLHAAPDREAFTNTSRCLRPLPVIGTYLSGILIVNATSPFATQHIRFSNWFCVLDGLRLIVQP
jgi:hypothetical protein